MNADQPDHMRTLCRRIILQTIRDLGKGRGKDFSEAVEYINAELFLSHQVSAEYPDELRDCLQEMVVVSEVERKYISRSVLALLETVWGD
jgi:hypothetical protein